MPSAKVSSKARAVPVAQAAETAASAAVRASLRNSAGRAGRRACCLLHDEVQQSSLMSVGDLTWEGRRWQQLEFAVDSGAVATVIPPHAVCGMSVVPSAGSQAGHCYHTADGGEIPNLGEVRL